MSENEFTFTFADDPEDEKFTEGLNLELYYKNVLIALCYKSKKTQEIILELNKYEDTFDSSYPSNSLPLNVFLNGLTQLKQKAEAEL